jgi:hypothetical protein
MYRHREKSLGLRRVELVSELLQAEAKQLLDETVPVFAAHTGLEEATVTPSWERYVIVTGANRFSLDLEYFANRMQKGKLSEQTETVIG